MKKYLNSDTLFGIAIIAACILFFFMGGELKGMKGQAGPGLFARIVAVVTGCLAFILVVNSIRDAMKGKVTEVAGTAADRKQFYYSLCLITVYLIAWRYVHFIICTEIFLLAMCWLLKLSKKFAIIYSTIFSVGIYYIFANVFRILL